MQGGAFPGTVGRRRHGRVTQAWLDMERFGPPGLVREFLPHVSAPFVLTPA